MTLGEALDRLRQAHDAFRRTPVATYRLQLNASLTLDQAAAVIPYLDALGVTDAYTSPFFETASASTHGYDVADHNRVRSDIGGEEALTHLTDALKRRGMGLLIDVVPNHMGIAECRNAWFSDVLEHGQHSRYAPFFDVDWTPVKPELRGKVLLPILGAQYGTALEAGELRLELAGDRFIVRYHDTALPITPRSYGRILGHGLDALQAALGVAHPSLAELKALIAFFVTVPAPLELEPGRRVVPEQEIRVARDRLRELVAASPEVRAFVEANLVELNGRPGDPRSFDPLDALLNEQAYRLAYWRVAGEEINYRRFFDVNQLAAIRMEDPAVFAETHRLVLRLIGQGSVTGLRIDHPDGLYAPAEYFYRLQRAAFFETLHRLGQVGPEVSASAVLQAYDGLAREQPTPPRPYYLIAEKILAAGEPIPETWAVSGTTGYEFLNLLNGIFVDRLQARAMEDIYARITRDRVSFPEIVYESKRVILETSMASELNVLGHHLNVISEKHRSSRDFTLGSLIRALREVIACFPVYRTYFGESAGEASKRDCEVVRRAVAAARRRTPNLDASVYDWLQDLLTLTFPEWADEADRQERADFVMRFQQFTGPVMAKGYEDTALYRYARLISLNEVGGDPSAFGTALGEFHAAMAERGRKWPAALSATATHDTKRGEDVRARINVLSEIPREWRERVGRWHRLNRRHCGMVDGRAVPDAEVEYFIYQTLVGAWPIDAARLRDYLLKAAHEAKVHTSWTNPNSRYDEALQGFADTILDRRRSREFLRDFAAFHARIVRWGIVNSLAQVLVKTTAPGVPDFYQGTELWDLSLVDPDNRRPVDFLRRRALLESLDRAADAASDRAAFARALFEAPEDGRVKLYVTHCALGLRRRQPDLFSRGEYRPVEARGELAEHLGAFARTTEHAASLTVVPRLLARRGLDGRPLDAGYWQDTRLLLPAEAGARFTNVLTGETVDAAPGEEGFELPAGAVLAHFPVAVLERAA